MFVGWDWEILPKCGEVWVKGKKEKVVMVVGFRL